MEQEIMQIGQRYLSKKYKGFKLELNRNSGVG